MIANVSGLSAFIDGHSHSTVEMKEVKDKDGKTVILTQTGSYFAALGQMTITKDGKITTKLRIWPMLPPMPMSRRSRISGSPRSIRSSASRSAPLLMR